MTLVSDNVLQACKHISENIATPADKLGSSVLLNAATTSMSSKYLSASDEFFSELVVSAVTSVKTTSETGKISYPTQSIHVLKAHGKGTKESKLFPGYALNMGRSAQGMPKIVKGAKIACLDMNLQKARLHMGIQIVVTDPKELEKIRARESDITKERIQLMLNAGANVFLTSKGIDDMSLKYFVEAGAIAVGLIECSLCLWLSSVFKESFEQFLR